MRRNRIRLTESDLHRIVKESLNKTLRGYGKRRLREAFDPYEDGAEYEEVTDALYDAYNEYIDAITAFQKFVYDHDDNSSDMYNSAAGKYGDEAKNLATQSYNRISKLFYDDYDG